MVHQKSKVKQIKYSVELLNFFYSKRPAGTNYYKARKIDFSRMRLSTHYTLTTAMTLFIFAQKEADYYYALNANPYRVNALKLSLGLGLQYKIGRHAAMLIPETPLY